MALTSASILRLNGLIFSKKLPTDELAFEIQLKRELILSITHWIGFNTAFMAHVISLTNPVNTEPTTVDICLTIEIIALNTGFKTLFQTLLMAENTDENKDDRFLKIG